LQARLKKWSPLRDILALHVYIRLVSDTVTNTLAQA
jgi:hypothetical protein